MMMMMLLLLRNEWEVWHTMLPLLFLMEHMLLHVWRDLMLLRGWAIHVSPKSRLVWYREVPLRLL
jgi:hypothetical protein